MIFEFLNQTGFLLGAILVSISCLIYTLAERHTDRPQNTIFIMMLVTLALSAGVEIGELAARQLVPGTQTSRLMIEFCNFTYYLLHGVSPLLLLYYTLFATRNFQRIRTRFYVVYLIPVALVVVMLITNPWFHMMYHLDDQMNYTRGWGVYYLYLIAPFYMLKAAHLFVFRWSGIKGRRGRIILFSAIVTIPGIIIQLIIPELKTEIFFECVFCMGLMISLEYDEDRMDTASGIYNRSALIQDTESYFETSKKFFVICVRVTNPETVRRVVGSTLNEEVYRMIADYLISVHPRYMTYKVSPSAFVLLSMRANEGQVRFLAQMISWKLEEGWEYEGRKLPIHGVVLYANAPDYIRSAEDILLVSEAPIPQKENGAILTSTDLTNVLRSANLEAALHRGLSEHNFRVFYQPVYAADGKKICSAESLIRLRDSEYGEILPGEFIPAAERNGMIEQIGEYTLEQVCDFLESRIPAKLGIRYINVNLSVVQCMDPDFVTRVKDIVSRYQVDPAWINFEITETVAALDYATLDDVIRELKSEGFLFSMEGYGTGYANLYSIFSLEFDMIKMDRKLLWEALKSGDGWIILDNSVRMVHELSHEAVVVGVENEEQFEKIRTLGVDWYQGNYFSPPLEREKLEQMAAAAEAGSEVEGDSR